MIVLMLEKAIDRRRAIPNPHEARPERRDRQSGRRIKRQMGMGDSADSVFVLNMGHLQVEVHNEPADERDASFGGRWQWVSAAGWRWKGGSKSGRSWQSWGGIAKLNDPWGDLVNWARELSVVEVKYRLFVDALRRLSGAVREGSLQPS